LIVGEETGRSHGVSAVVVSPSRAFGTALARRAAKTARSLVFFSNRAAFERS
jgi:hypothetical protein